MKTEGTCLLVLPILRRAWKFTPKPY